MTELTLENLKEKIVFGPTYFGTNCWFWKTVKDKTVYTTVFHAGKQISLHRLVYTLVHGEIPVRGVIDHLCMNKGCCNPEHLELVSHSENIRRAFEKKPRVKKEITKNQITVTLQPDAIKYVKDLADAQFEGNASMAFGKIIAEHSKTTNYTSRDDP